MEGTAVRGTYIGAVPAEDYSRESILVVEEGSLLVSPVAQVLFKGQGLPAQPIRPATIFDEESVKPRRGLRTRPVSLNPSVIELDRLDRRVLAIAFRWPDRSWGARVGAISGDQHVYEGADVVLRKGSEVSFDLAEVLFEDLGKDTRGGGERWHGEMLPAGHERSTG